MLDSIQMDYQLPITLYSKLKKSIKINYKKDAQTVTEFVGELPLNLKFELSMVIFKDLYSQIDYLEHKSEKFISWLCPLLKTHVAQPQESVFYEGDPIKNIYFVK